MKEAGEIIICGDGPETRQPTLQCVHCGCHWVASPGSGRVRGYCMNCNGPVCGPGCSKCVPMEQMLENIEQGRALDFKPIRTNVPGLWVP